MTVQAGLCRTWSETPKTGFLTSRLKFTLQYALQAEISTLIIENTASLCVSDIPTWSDIAEKYRLGFDDYLCWYFLDFRTEIILYAFATVKTVANVT